MNVDKSIFRWDRYSDQPATLDNRAKRRLRWRSIPGIARKLLSVFLLAWPVVQTVVRPRTIRTCSNECSIGLCINLERPFASKKILSAPEILGIVKPLNLRRIAIRIPLSDMDGLAEYVEFIRHFSEYEILVVLLQDRNTIEDPELLEANLGSIFSALSGIVDLYQIGNAVNRLKWGFLSVDEWFPFFSVAWNLRNSRFPHIRLLGGAIIDFELQDHCRSLRNGFPFTYDGYASLLYVDRHGAPENRQMGFDLEGKIDLLRRIMENGNKAASGDARLWITEVNWPLRDTGPFAPALGDSRVGEREQLFFMVRYYLIALATGSVAAVYWHQLIAPGYGLVDNRDGVVRKRPAFRGFATLCRLFNGAVIEDFRRQDTNGHYQVTARRDGGVILAMWCNGRESTISMPADKQAIDIEGHPISATVGQPIAIGESVVYLVGS